MFIQDFLTAKNAKSAKGEFVLSGGIGERVE